MNKISTLLAAVFGTTSLILIAGALGAHRVVESDVSSGSIRQILYLYGQPVMIVGDPKTAFYCINVRRDMVTTTIPANSHWILLSNRNLWSSYEPRSDKLFFYNRLKQMNELMITVDNIASLEIAKTKILDSILNDDFKGASDVIDVYMHDPTTLNPKSDTYAPTLAGETPHASIR